MILWSDILRITNRIELAAVVEGVCVELGVAEGAYSRSILSNPKVETLFSIDRWAGDRGHDDAQYCIARYNLSGFAGRSRIIREDFSDAVKRFHDGCFDFVYVDGYAHDGQCDGRTLREWWPKVKPGGILAGHDYHDAWPRTVEAVNGFVARRGLRMHLTKPCPFPSWIVQK